MYNRWTASLYRMMRNERTLFFVCANVVYISGIINMRVRQAPTNAKVIIITIMEHL